MPDLSRRDFLKLGAMLSAGAAVPLISRLDPRPVRQTDKPNVILMVFDAMAARNSSLYGYPRNTTPNLDRLASRAMVYHSHYSAGNFTTSGTATMLLGVHPWSHRAINLGGLVNPEFARRSLFHHLNQDHYCDVFAQNYYANVLLGQFRRDIDRRLPASSFALPEDPALLERYFPHDPVPTFYALEQFGFTANGMPSAPLLEMIYDLGPGAKNELGGTSDAYPYGIPDNSIFRFENPVVYDGVYQEILSLHEKHKPFIGYFHLFSPHEPYAPRREFIDIFPDLPLPKKPMHRLSSLDYPQSTIKQRRKQYDEYLADVDHEIGRLVDALEASGVLDSSYLILTSDHGELFERGEYGHVTRFLYEGVIHVPLLILAPGQRQRQDIQVRTSHLDLAPSILAMTGTEIPSGMEGQVLPGLGGQADPSRPIFCLEAKESSAFGPLPRATVSLTRGDYKLIYYTGYPKVPDLFELYDLRNDPEEMQDLFAVESQQASRMKDELLENFEKHRRPGGKL